MHPALHVTPNLQRLPEFPGDEPLVVDEDFSGSDSSDEEAAIDLAQAASSARSALQRLAARQDLFLPASWADEDSEARRDPEAEASSELVGTLRELAEVSAHHGRHSSRSRNSSSGLGVRPRRVSTYPDFLEKDDANHSAGPAIRRIRSAHYCPAEEGVRRPSALEAEMPVPDEALRYSKSLSYDEGRVSPPDSPKTSPCSAQRPTDQAAADEEELSAKLDAPSGMRQRRVSKPPEPIEEDSTWHEEPVWEGRPSDATEPEQPVPSESGTKSPAEGSTHEEAKDASPPDSVPPSAVPREDPLSREEEASHLRFSFEAELGPPILIEGQLWKKRPKLSRTTKVFRLLRREARALLSRGEEWLAGGGSLHLGRVGILAREVMALLGTHDAPRSLEDSQDVQPVSEKYVDDITQEPVWDKTPVCLREGGILSWVRPSSERPTLQERNEERSPTLDAQRLGEVGPLRGSSVEYMGPQRSPQTPGGSDPEGSLYVFRIFPTHNLRRQPLTFAAESLADAELWIAKLQAGMAPPRPPPPAARRCARLVEFWEAKGPPLDAEPPPAWLRLEVLRTAGLVASSEAGEARNSAGSLQAEGGPAPFASVAGTHNLYVLGRVHSSYFRTATRYGVDCSGVTQFGHCFELPLVLENPDEHVELMVYHEPEYDDSEPVLLGGICVPLFAFRRGKRLCLQLPLKQDDATRRGLVNVAFGHLTIAVYVDQPLGHLFLPVEPPLDNDQPASAQRPTQAGLNWEDLEKQISRLVELIQMVFGRWQMNVIYVIQWESFYYSLGWLLFLEVWFLIFWRWSLTVLIALLLKRTLDLRPKKDDKASVGSSDVEERPKGSDAKPRRSPDETTRRAGSSESTQCDAPDVVIWEAERRFMFGGFSCDYLIEGFDVAPFMDAFGNECGWPQAFIYLGDVRYRYQWEIVVNAETDENGWQYAFAFTYDAQWRRTMDTVSTWVRRRQHHGRCLGLAPEDFVGKGDVGTGNLGIGSPSFDESSPEQTKAPVESMLTENDQYNRYISLYLSIRNDVDFTLSLLERHKNLFTWKDHDVSTIIVVLLAALLVLTWIVPTSVIFAFIIAFTFYIGSAMGQRKRQHREDFLKELSKLSNSITSKSIVFNGDELCKALEEKGVTRLTLRDWCNANFKTQFNLKSFDPCRTLAELADLVVESSPLIETTVRRYRAWHSDVYGNFLDHVPSDSTDYDSTCVCYGLGGAPLTEVPEELPVNEEPEIREQAGEKQEPEAEETSEADIKEEPAVREDTQDGDAEDEVLEGKDDSPAES